MLPERLGLEEQPFHRNESEKSNGFLKVLNLNFESTADDVRRVAISMRRQMQEKGLNIESVKALKWALERTNDCQDERQFLWFLLDDFSFKSVESGRSW